MSNNSQSNNNQLEQLNQWFSEIKTNLPILTKPQAYVLALLSFGMTIASSSGFLLLQIS